MTDILAQQSLWIGFYATSNTYAQATNLREQQNNVYAHFQQRYHRNNFVSLFNTTGILQHSDMNPAYHPTDVSVSPILTLLRNMY